MSPNCWGTSFGGSVSGPNVAPKLGPHVVRVPGGVCDRVLWIHHPGGASLVDSMVSVRIHPRPIPDAGAAEFWSGCWKQRLAGIKPWMTRVVLICVRTDRHQRPRLRPLLGEGPKRQRTHPSMPIPQRNLHSHVTLQKATTRRANALETMPNCLPTSITSCGHTPTVDTDPTRNPRTHAYERRNGFAQHTEDHRT